MSLLLKLSLIAHVLFGFAAIILSYAFLINVLKKEPRVGFLLKTSVAGFLAFIASWLFGAYYYVVYYGAAVRPVIKAGAYPWAHAIMMETKEHAFLFLPFLAAVLALAAWLLRENVLKEEIKKPLAVLALVIVILGTAVTVMGFAVSAAAR